MKRLLIVAGAFMTVPSSPRHNVFVAGRPRKVVKTVNIIFMARSLNDG
jgi:hypothetical protein